jgi:hypothetical protein
MQGGKLLTIASRRGLEHGTRFNYDILTPALEASASRTGRRVLWLGGAGRRGSGRLAAPQAVASGAEPQAQSEASGPMPRASTWLAATPLRGRLGAPVVPQPAAFPHPFPITL